MHYHPGEGIVRLAHFFQAVLAAAALVDLGERLWTIRIQFDFRTFAELVGAVLLVGSVYIVRRDKANRETARAERYKDSIEARIATMERWWRGEDQAYLFASRLMPPDPPKLTFP